MNLWEQVVPLGSLNISQKKFKKDFPREIFGNWGEVIDSIQFTFGSSKSELHGGTGGFASKTCTFSDGEHIVTVRGATTTSNEGFLTTLEFETTTGAKCRIGQDEPNAFEVRHRGFHLAYISGTFGQWKGTVKTIKSVILHWKQ